MPSNFLLNKRKFKLSAIAAGITASLVVTTALVGCNGSKDVSSGQKQTTDNQDQPTNTQDQATDTQDQTTDTQSQSSYLEQYRPQLQYSAAKNWLNDPNGLVYFDGEYHMFYQYNPNGDNWGDMSWGHAVSTDLVHWEELPVALEVEKDFNGNVTQMFFSGSAIVDVNNTSGLGEQDKPAMVAMYTSVYPSTMTLGNGKRVEAGTQAQSIAYSLDKGRTWSQYAGNPVIERPPAGYDDLFREFRDPKVFWYEPEQKWVMIAVLATEYKAVLYESNNLIDWNFMSEFGPANAVGGIWECPDLFEMPIDGDPNNTKWVMVINLNPGGPNGGSGSQYILGDFDGTTFTADPDSIYGNNPPEGILVEDFEESNSTLLGWTATNDLIDSFLARGNQSGQEGVKDYQGSQLLNTYVDGDAAVGTITSPKFTINNKYINLMVGGGNHPRNPDAVLDAAVPAGELLFLGADFEGPNRVTYTELGWLPTKDLIDQTVATGSLGGQQPVSGFVGSRLANTFVDGDAPVGSIISPTFTISKPYINFLVGGGNHPYESEGATAVVLKVNNEVVRTATGKDSETLEWTNWDVTEFVGQSAKIEIIDENTGSWGHINADQFMASDEPAHPISTETSVNLIVDGDIVNSETGSNSETLTWRSWNVASLVGKQAQIRVVDNNTGSWGHLLVDHIMQSAQPKRVANWSDYGSDFYAAVSWNGVPDNKRLWVGWMSNWNYANSTPTSPWRSALTFVREMKLQTINGKVELTQSPVDNFAILRGTPLYELNESTQIVPGGSLLADNNVESQVFEIEAEIAPQNATDVGFKLRTGINGQETIVGYDVLAGAVYIDRTNSGDSSFSSDFASRHSSPLPLSSESLKLRIIVDTSSVTVFAGNGEVVLTDQIFTDPTSNGMEVFTIGSSAILESLTVWPLISIWADK